ncbi:MAG: hypothetical protein WBX25_00050 [Rhodomicrobium sp.]
MLPRGTSGSGWLGIPAVTSGFPVIITDKNTILGQQRIRSSQAESPSSRISLPNPNEKKIFWFPAAAWKEWVFLHAAFS